MASPETAQRWETGDSQFAVRIDVADAPGFFSKKLTIEPGTCALIIEEGQYLGQVPPGTYTLESFAERLQLWRRKQAQVILTRQEDFPLEVSCSHLPTAENLVVGATLRLVVQMEDVALFERNLLGNRRIFTASDLRQTLAPLIEQSLWETVGRMSITDLTGPNARPEIDAAVEQALGISLRRYGLRFIGVRTVSIRHEQYDEQRRKLGEVWLQKEGLTQQQALQELSAQEELLKIQGRERENELASLAEHVEMQRMGADLASQINRIALRGKLREACLSEQFDKLKNEDDLREFLAARDKERLLGEAEKSDLLASFQQRQEDREAARKHLVAKLDLERRLDVDAVRAELDHAMRMKKLEHEAELARQVATQENLDWQRQMQREQQTAELRQQQQARAFQLRREWARQEAAHLREEEWDSLLQQQRLEQLKSEIESAQAERQARVQKLDSELKAALEHDRLETERRRKEWELSVAGQEAKSQLQKLAAVQQLNDESARRQFDLYDRQQRLDVELEVMRADKAGHRELARLQVMAGMSSEALIATTGVKRAGILADLKKHEATQKAISVQAGATLQAPGSDERAKRQEKLSQAEKEKADAVIAAYREAMQMQQQNVQQTISALSKVTPGSTPLGGASPGPTPPAPPTPPFPSPLLPPSLPGHLPGSPVLVCPLCRAQNAAASQFCSACGSRLR